MDHLYAYCRSGCWVLLLGSLLVSTSMAQDSRVELTRDMVRATDHFLSTLNELQRNNGQFDFTDEERLNWHFIPRTRQGVPLKSMDATQRQAARDLLQTFFSPAGFAKTEAVRGLENVLAEIEVGGRFVRDPELYYLSVFGEPSLDGTWALRYEGHHLAFNWTFVEGQGIASSPQFFGSNPAEVRTGTLRGTRVLAAEEDLARELVTSLDTDQAAMAIIRRDDVPPDIFTSARVDIEPLEASGITYADLNSEQRLSLIRLIEEVAAAQPDSMAEQRVADIRAQGLDDIQFAWIGSTAFGEGHYWRVQGPGFLIEYDNIQSNANHIHLVWRDFNGDFGRDLLRLHYDAVAHTNPVGARN